MPDPFSTLPSPLPIFILKGFEDLGSLDYLLQASPAATAIFAEHYAEITESILSNFVPNLQKIMRIVVAIRSQPSAIREQCASKEAFEAFRMETVFALDAGSVKMGDRVITLKAVRSFVGTAASVQQLMGSFFETFLKRVNDIEPHYFIGPRPDLLITALIDYYGGRPTPELKRYKVLDSQKPSWIEEQRVLRALWRLVTFLDLKALLQTQDGERTKVWHILAELGPRGIWEVPPIEVNSNQSIMCHTMSAEIDDILAFLVEGQGTVAESDQISACLNILPMPAGEHLGPPQPSPGVDLKQAVSRLDSLATGRRFINRAAHKVIPEFLYCSSNNEPIVNDFKPLQALGFGIWDDERLMRLGLMPLSPKGSKKHPQRYEEHLPAPNRILTRSTDCYIRWWSLIVKEPILGSS